MKVLMNFNEKWKFLINLKNVKKWKFLVNFKKMKIFSKF
jgi:hypothetical protein